MMFQRGCQPELFFSKLLEFDIEVFRFPVISFCFFQTGSIEKLIVKFDSDGLQNFELFFSILLNCCLVIFIGLFQFR